MRVLLCLGLLAFLLVPSIQGQAPPQSVTLMWDAPVFRLRAALVGYRVYRHAAGQPYGAAVCTVPATRQTCTDVVASLGTYTYAVVGDYGAAGLSAPSVEVTVIVQSQAPAQAPPALRLTLTQAGDPYPLRPIGSVHVYAVDSQEMGAYPAPATYAVDGLLTTYWHTVWSLKPPPPLPHTLTLDLGRVCLIDGLVYTPRQDGEANGTIARYTLAVSEDATRWVLVVSAGLWASDTTPKTVRFPAAVGRYVRLTATAEISGLPYTSAAEVGIFAIAAE